LSLLLLNAGEGKYQATRSRDCGPAHTRLRGITRNHAWAHCSTRRTHAPRAPPRTLPYSRHLHARDSRKSLRRAARRARACAWAAPQAENILLRAADLCRACERLSLLK